MIDMYYGNVRTDETTGNYMLTTTKQTEEINCVGDTACAGKYYIANPNSGVWLYGFILATDK